MALRGDKKVITEEWDRVKELFESALECPALERPAFLSRLEQEYPRLAEEVSRLLSSHAQAGDFLNQPLILPADFLDELEEPQRFSHDDVLCNRFRIIRLIGKGGMGEVYEAFDQELEEHVALKTLRFEVSSNEIFNARFRREIQLARKVTHPNVCRIFESLRHHTGNETISVLSMELLQGQTLADYLKTKGRLTAEEALPLARQIVDGLSAVHAAGIIHRDLKPSNLVLVPQGEGFRVKITDFGIAGRLPENPSQPTLTQGSKMLGTPDYMAPEQLEHGRATLQSDMYALGLVLYEMVAGVKPFGQSGAWKRLTEDPPPAKKTAPDLPTNWNRTIACCLERKPEYRFSSVEAVGQSLIEDRRQELVPTKPFPVRVKAAARKGRWFILAFLVVFAAIVLAAMRYLRPGPQIPPGTTVLVTDITTTDPALSGITVALKGELAQSAHFGVEEDSKIVDVLRQMNRKPDDALDAKTAREVAWRSGIPLVIYGSLTSTKDGYLLSIGVERVQFNPRFPVASWKNRFTSRDKLELLDAVHRASTWIRELAGESAADLAQQDRPVEDTTTASWQALVFLKKATESSAREDYESAALFLQDAIKSDPDFALAHMRLADVLVSMNQYDAGYAEWQRAISLTDKNELTSRENLRIKGQFYEDTGDYQSAEKVFREFTLHYPSDYLSWFLLGSALDALDRKDEALGAFAKAAQINSKSFAVEEHLAELNLLLGRFAEAELHISRVEALGGKEWASLLRATAALRRGDPQRCLEQADQLLQSTQTTWQSRGALLKASFLAEAGMEQEAISTLQQGIGFDREHHLLANLGTKIVALSYLFLKGGDKDQAQEMALQAASSEGNFQTLMDAGILLAKLGNTSKAHEISERLGTHRQFPWLQFAVHRVNGEIALQHSDTGGALKEFLAAASIAPPRENRDYLAQALMLTGKSKASATVYSDTINQPARIWLYSRNQMPGLWSDLSYGFWHSFKADEMVQSCALSHLYIAMSARSNSQLRHDRVSEVQQMRSLVCKN